MEALVADENGLAAGVQLYDLRNHEGERGRFTSPVDVDRPEYKLGVSANQLATVFNSKHLFIPGIYKRAVPLLV